MFFIEGSLWLYSSSLRITHVHLFIIAWIDFDLVPCVKSSCSPLSISMATYHITSPHSVNLIITTEGFLCTPALISCKPVSVSVFWSCSPLDKKRKKLFRSFCVRSESRIFSFSPSPSEEDAESFKLPWQQQQQQQRSYVSVSDYAFVPESVSDYSSFKQEFPNNGRARDETPSPPLSIENDIPPENKGLDISTLGLHSALVSALQRRGITHMFPIQVHI